MLFRDGRFAYAWDRCVASERHELRDLQGVRVWMSVKETVSERWSWCGCEPSMVWQDGG